MQKNFILTLAFFLFAYQSIAQKPIDDAVDEADQLLQVFDQASIAITDAKSRYNFYLEKKTNQLQIENLEKKRLVSLKSNADHVIKYFYNDNSSIDDYSIENSKGRKYPHNTYNGHYEVENIFYSDAKVSAYAFKAKLKGEQINFTLNKTYQDPKYLTKVFFHNKIPTKKRTIEFLLPYETEVELLEMNFENFDIIKNEKILPEGKLIRYEVYNLDKLPEDSNLPGYLHFMPHLLVLTKSYKVNGNLVKVLSSVDDLYRWYSSLTKKLANDPEALRQKVNEITSGLTTDNSKMKALYYWVQDNIKYIAFLDGIAGFKPEDAHKVFYNRYGDCKGMANLLKEMLKIAGIDARLAWIGTNIIPYNYDTPSLAVDNHMICAVLQGEEKIFLDPTEKYQSISSNAERIQGREILIEDGDQYIIDEVPKEPLAINLEEKTIAYKLQDNTLLADGKAIYNGENLKSLLNAFNYLDNEKIDKFLRDVVCGADNINNFILNSYSEPDRDSLFQVSFAANLQNQFNTYDEEIYLALDYEKDFSHLEIEEERKSPFDFGKRIFKKTSGQLKIPEGYQVQYFPKPVKIEDDDYHFILKYQVEGNQINYEKEIKIYKSVIPVNKFEKWNEIVNQLNNFYNDQVILKPIN